MGGGRAFAAHFVYGGDRINVIAVYDDQIGIRGARDQLVVDALDARLVKRGELRHGPVKVVFPNRIVAVAAGALRPVNLNFTLGSGCGSSGTGQFRLMRYEK